MMEMENSSTYICQSGRRLMPSNPHSLQVRFSPATFAETSQTTSMFTHKPTDRTDYNTLHRSFASAQCSPQRQTQIT